MEQLHRRNSPDIPKYVVYRDTDYPTSWIDNNKLDNYKNANTIVDYLTNKTTKNVPIPFVEKNGDKLRNWMENLIKKESAKGYVVVFSQDVVPETVFYDKSDCLIRDYLNFGGRVVWIGDIPFSIKGKKKEKIPILKIIDGQAQYVGEYPDLEGMRFNDTYALLGSFPAFAFSESKVEITKEGLEKGLSKPWYSIRPVHPRYIAPWGKRKKYILANSNLRYPLRDQDINPQRVKGEGASAFSSIKSMAEFLHTSFSLPAILIALLSAFFVWIINLSKINVNYFLLGSILLFFSIIIFLIWIYIRKRKKCFASAWIKSFQNDGQFIRIWDCRPKDVPDQMLKDLYQVAIHDME